MYDRILFPTDGSEAATAAFEHVLDIAAAHDATVHVLNVADTTRDSVIRIRGQIVDALESEGERIVDEAAERATERGVAAETAVLQGAPEDIITEYAAERDIDLVAMPTHGRQGLSRLFLGSVTERVVRQSDVPVLTLRPDAEFDYPYDSVLFPTDGSDSAAAAFDVACDTVVTNDAALHVLSVVNVASLGAGSYTREQTGFLEEEASDVVESTVTDAEERGIESVVGVVEHDTSIHARILSYVEDHDIDLLVVGTHGRTGLDRYLLGSVTEKLVRTSPVPVLTVHEPNAETEGEAEADSGTDPDA